MFWFWSMDLVGGNALFWSSAIDLVDGFEGFHIPGNLLWSRDLVGEKGFTYTADWPAVNVVDSVAHARIPAAPALAVDE